LKTLKPFALYNSLQNGKDFNPITATKQAVGDQGIVLATTVEQAYDGVKSLFPNSGGSTHSPVLLKPFMPTQNNNNGGVKLNQVNWGPPPPIKTTKS